MGGILHIDILVWVRFPDKHMSTGKRKARFPVSRIKQMMRTDDDVGRISSGVPPLVSKCVELFAVELLEKSAAAASQHDAQVINVQHIKEAIDTEPLFDFLRELVAEMVTSCPESHGVD